MDARFVRSRTLLRAAALELAAARPVADITVAELCRRAGVTRETFYRHAPSVADLLAAALGEELEAALARVPPTEPVGVAERALLTHVADRALVYRHAMNPLLIAPVRHWLDRSLRAGLTDLLARRPELVPSEIAGDPVAVSMAVAYAAAGTIGAVEEWLRTGATDVDRAVEIVLAASPQLWLAPEDP